MTIRMRFEAMAVARRAWEEQADALHGSRRNLAQADPGRLGGRVGPVAARFLATWESRLDTLRRAASDHADALAGAAYDVHAADVEQDQAVRGLLMWSDRDTQSFRHGRTP